MRILMLTSSYEPLSGGAETYARILCEGLASRGHEVVVATDGSWVTDRMSHQVERGVDVFRLKKFADRVESLDNVKWREMQFAVLSELGAALAGRPFDVIHANSHEALILASIIALDMDCALVCSLHEQNPDLEYYGKGRCKLSYQILPVQRYLAASEFYHARALSYGVARDRLRLIYHGVPYVSASAEQCAAFRAALPIGAGDNLIVLPGRVYKRKAQLDLIAALPIVLESFPTAKVLLAGRVSDFEYERVMWELIDQNGLRSAVVLRQDFGATDMPVVFGAANLVVQPSLEEGLGLALIEAMAAAKPIVATQVVGISEVVTHNEDGLLVPAESPQKLAEAIVALLRSPETAKRLATNARSTASSRFGVETMLDLTTNAYVDAIAECQQRGLLR